MDEDGVQQSGVANESLWAAVVIQRDAAFCQQRAVGDVGAVPFWNGGHRLSDNEIGAFLRQLLGYGGDGVSESESGEPDRRLAGGPEGGASEAGEFFLRRAGGRAADFLAVDEEGLASVVLLEREGIPVRELGFCESDSWFHGA